MGRRRASTTPRLFVKPALVCSVAERHGVRLTVRGIRPAALPMAAVAGDPARVDVPIVPTRSTAALYQAWGVKEGE